MLPKYPELLESGIRILVFSGDVVCLKLLTLVNAFSLLTLAEWMQCLGTTASLLLELCRDTLVHSNLV